MRPSLPSIVPLLLLSSGVAACIDPGRAVQPAAAVRADRVNDDLPVPVYGVGLEGHPGDCRAGHFRDFDFWAGTFAVGPVGAPTTAASVNTLELDGCALVEHWAPGHGVAGRSLNSYDAVAGVWRQTWVVEQNNSGARPFRMAGNVDATGTMVMDGVRHAWYNANVTYLNHYTWAPVDPTHVAETNALDIPIANLHFHGALNYVRADAPPPSQSPGSTNCMAGGDAAENRMLDFTVGHWDVRVNGRHVGWSTIDTALSGCLNEERHDGTGDFHAIGWLYYDPIENAYFRSFVDSHGTRVELRGAPTVNPLVLEGPAPIANAPNARVRLTWTSTSADLMTQAWELSRDGGATWTPVTSLEFRRGS